MSKKATLLALLFFLALAFVLFSADRLISGILSQKSGFSIQVHRVRMARWGEWSFSDLEAARKAGEKPWLRAARGLFSFKNFGVYLEKVEVASPAWLGKNFLPGSSRFDRVRFVLGGRGGVRGLRATAAGMRLEGGAQFDERELKKLNLRGAFSPQIFSRWPPSFGEKMMPDSHGWRALGALFYKGTWTLRGQTGPLVQFSAGNLNSR